MTTRHHITHGLISKIQIASESNVLTTYITLEMAGFESDALGSATCSSGTGDDAVMGRQLAQQFDLSFIPAGTPYVATIDINDTYFAEIEILWIDLTAGADPLDPELAYTLAPNPTKGEFHIHAAKNTGQLFNVTVVDMVGQTVFSASDISANQTIDITEHEAGAYFVYVESNGKRKVLSIMLR